MSYINWKIATCSAENLDPYCASALRDLGFLAVPASSFMTSNQPLRCCLSVSVNRINMLLELDIF
jgi:hypothetical protein